jgi:hypothetical protein
MVDAIECRCQVRVEDPPSVRVLAPDRREDRLDGVMAAAAAGPDAIRHRLEPCFPLWVQCVECPRLKSAVNDHRDAGSRCVALRGRSDQPENAYRKTTAGSLRGSGVCSWDDGYGYEGSVQDQG